MPPSMTMSGRDAGDAGRAMISSWRPTSPTAHRPDDSRRQGTLPSGVLAYATASRARPTDRAASPPSASACNPEEEEEDEEEAPLCGWAVATDGSVGG